MNHFVCNCGYQSVGWRWHCAKCHTYNRLDTVRCQGCFGKTRPTMREVV